MKKLISVLALTLIANVALADECKEKAIKAAKSYYEVEERGAAYMNSRGSILYPDLKVLGWSDGYGSMSYRVSMTPVHYDGFVMDEAPMVHYTVYTQGDSSDCSVSKVIPYLNR